MKKVRSLMVRIIPILAVLAVIIIPLLSPAIVQATAVVSLYRGPNPPCYVLNNGATPESLWWKITFDTTPDEATLEIFDPDDLLVYSDTFDLTGATSPVYNPENSVGDPGMTNPAYAYNWSISAGAKAGVYVAVLTFSSEEVPDESAALQTFWVRQRVAVYKYEDENGNHIDDGEPPLSGWNFTVSCPPPHAGHGGITYTAALVLGNPGDSGGDFWGVTNSTGFAVFQSGDPTAPPLCTVGPHLFVDVLNSGGYNVTETLKSGWMNTDPGGSPPYAKTFLVPDPAGATIVVKFGNEELIPGIDVEKYVFDGTSWYDADSPTGPYVANTTNPVVFRFEITNNGTTDLTNVTLTDTDMISTFYTNQACTIPATFPIATLAQGAAAVTVYGKLNWAAGQHSNTATVTGTPPVGPNVSDTDPAHYFGSDPKIDVEKYVYDGTTWHDADTPTGPNIPSSINPVVFRFVITNTGNVDLTSVTLSDTDMSAFYTNQACTTPATFPIPTLAQGAASVTVYGKLNWAAGQHSNTATVTGTPPSGPNVTDTDPAHYFGAQPACVRICKFEDANVNGMWDPGEEYLPDWRFHVTGPGGFDTWVTTGADGCVQVNVPVVGTYTVTEELKPGWYNTRPGGDPPYEQDVMIVGTGTDCTRVEFGNREEIKIVPPNIPTLNQWGIIAMIAVFAGLLVWTVRRRRIAS